jgi:hypothetical protein
MAWIFWNFRNLWPQQKPLTDCHAPRNTGLWLQEQPMPNDSPEDNRVYCKAYYERVKLDPAKLADRQAKRAAAQRLRRAKQRGKE